MEKWFRPIPVLAFPLNPIFQFTSLSYSANNATSNRHVIKKQFQMLSAEESQTSSNVALVQLRFCHDRFCHYRASL